MKSKLQFIVIAFVLIISISASSIFATNANSNTYVSNINMNKLNSVKDRLAKEGFSEALYAVMDVAREWEKVLAHRKKRQSIEKTIRAAFKSASEGHFSNAELVMEDISSMIEEEDQNIFGDNLPRELEQKLAALDALVNRETVKTGKQAGEKYYLEVTRTFQNLRVWTRGKGSKVKKKKVKEKLKHDFKEMPVFVPELSTDGRPIYDEATRIRLGFKHETLTSKDFQGEIIGMLQPYSEVESKSRFSFHKSFVRGELVDSLLSPRASYVLLDGYDWIDSYKRKYTPKYRYWSDYYKVNRVYIQNPDKDIFVKYDGVAYRPLSAIDKGVWSGAIKQAMYEVREVLDEMYERSEKGYKFRAHSESYDYFVGKFKRLVNNVKAIQSVEFDDGSYFIPYQDEQNLTEEYSILIGDRPDTLEKMVEVALGNTPSKFKHELASALTYTNQRTKSYSTGDVIEIKGMKGTQILERLSEVDQDIFVDGLVELYMSGNDQEVTSLFIDLSSYIKNKISNVSRLLDDATEKVKLALDNSTKQNISKQLSLLEKAQSVVENAKNEAFKPDYLVETKEETTALKFTKEEKIYKRIYKKREELETLQKNLRDSFSSALKLMLEAKSLYMQAPTIEVREAFVSTIQYYNSKVEFLNSEFWPYLEFIPIDKDKDIFIYNIGAAGEQEVVTKQRHFVLQLPLFNSEQLSKVQVSNIISYEELEEAYLSDLVDTIYQSFEYNAEVIGRVYQEFEEYPSHSVSVLLQKSLESFSNNKRIAIETIDELRFTSELVDYTNVTNIRNAFKENLKAINWLEGSNETDMIMNIESLRDQYNDLLIPVNL